MNKQSYKTIGNSNLLGSTVSMGWQRLIKNVQQLIKKF